MEDSRTTSTRKAKNNEMVQAAPKAKQEGLRRLSGHPYSGIVLPISEMGKDTDVDDGPVKTAWLETNGRTPDGKIITRKTCGYVTDYDDFGPAGHVSRMKCEYKGRYTHYLVVHEGCNSYVYFFGCEKCCNEIQQSITYMKCL